MAGHKNHDYHILAPSIWPLVGAVGALLMLFGAVLLFHGHGPWLALIGFVAVLYTRYSWWSDVAKPAGRKPAAEPSSGSVVPLRRREAS
jgi:cytochrome c oxidase subunit 3